MLLGRAPWFIAGARSACGAQPASGVVDLTNPGIDCRDRSVEGQLEASRSRGPFVVGVPMGVPDNGWRPGSFRQSKLVGFVSAGLEQRSCGSMDLGKCRTSGLSGEVAQQQQVDDIAGAIVDGIWRIVRIRDGVDLLRNLKAHSDPNEDVGVREAEPIQWRRLDDFKVLADA